MTELAQPIDDEPATLTDEQLAELRRRIEAVERGEAVLVDEATARARLRAFIETHGLAWLGSSTRWADR